MYTAEAGKKLTISSESVRYMRLQRAVCDNVYLINKNASRTLIGGLLNICFRKALYQIGRK
ncbi:hypothetical protein HMPREF9370_1367 [Neisseria wadsworthii 9715]|uniref:Uncharacterized protein n=1 Tax=Neisseria wadsworthii 9715 TaxID=1030841 RepID=G4CQK7_9NEIS|nr:hypothetical protein HMPREF9370_1367 [Neisseria wadsworthii 9715]